MIPWLLHNLQAGGFDGTIETVHSVRLTSWLPGWTVPFLIVLIAGATVLQYRRQRRASWQRRVVLVVLRVAAYAAALLVVARPDLAVDAGGFVPGPVPVIVDGTQSMQIQDAGGRPRSERAVRLASALSARRDDYPELRLASYWAGRSFRAFGPGVEVEPDGDSTSIGGMLEHGLRPHFGSYHPGVVLLFQHVHELCGQPHPIFPVRGIAHHVVHVVRVRAQVVEFLGRELPEAQLKQVLDAFLAAVVDHPGFCRTGVQVRVDDQCVAAELVE